MASNDTFDVRDERFDNDDDDPRPARRQKQGWSTGMKVLVTLLVLGGLTMVACCGGFIFMGNRLAKNIKEGVTEDPVRVVEIRDGIAAIDVPESLPPKMGTDFNMFGLFTMQMAMHGEEQGPMLILMQMQVSGLKPEDMEREFRKQSGDQHGGENVTITSSETRTFTIDGKECDFVFAKGTMEADAGMGGPAMEGGAAAPDAEPAAESAETSPETVPSETAPETPSDPAPESAPGPGKKAVRQVSGMFPGRNGTAFLLLITPEEKWNEDEVVKMIESIRK